MAAPAWLSYRCWRSVRRRSIWSPWYGTASIDWYLDFLSILVCGITLRRFRYLTSPRCYITPLLGAYVADAKLGRYNTVCVAVAIALVGHVLLIVASVPGVVENPDSSLACFILGLIIMGLGTGFFKANIAPLVAEQYRKTKLFIRVTKSGERVIVDPVFTVSRVYMVCTFHFTMENGQLIPRAVFLPIHQCRSSHWVDYNGLR